MGQEDKNLVNRPFKRNNRCKIILEKNKIIISCFYNSNVYGKVENKAFWTFLLRNQTLFKNLEKDFVDYRKNPKLEKLYNIEDRLKKLDPIYFKHRAKSFIIEELEAELNNEFYYNMRRAGFKDVKKEAEIFIVQRMKIVLMPYLKDCGKEVLFEESESCFSYILKDFNGFQSHLSEKMLQDYGCIAQPIGKVNLLLDIFRKIVFLQQEKKASCDKKLEDYFQDEYDKASQDNRWQQMQMLISLLEECESLHRKREIQRKFEMPKNALTIHSYTELLLLQIERFLNEIPKINVAICKNCGQIFVGEHGKREYCPYLFDEEKFCSDIGKNETRKRKKEENPGLSCYETIYNRMQKRVRRAEGYPKEQEKRRNEFNEWEKEAQKMRDEYINGDITKEQFVNNIKQEFQEKTGENMQF